MAAYVKLSSVELIEIRESGCTVGITSLTKFSVNEVGSNIHLFLQVGLYDGPMDGHIKKEVVQKLDTRLWIRLD